MQKLKYDLGHSPINIYLDRPNIYLEQLVSINARLFVIGKYEGPLSFNYRKVLNITPDIKPDIFISQTKLENFDTLKNVAKEYGAKFVHYETGQMPQRIDKRTKNILLSKEADIDVFIDECLMEVWGFNQTNAIVIENGLDQQYLSEHDKPYLISTHIPMNYMLGGICPIIYKTEYTEKYITNGLNGLLYSDSASLGNVVNHITKMDKEDVGQIGKNARELILTKFKNNDFLLDWKKLLRGII